MHVNRTGLANFRKNFCEHVCESPCDEQMAGRLDYSDFATACPKGNWRARTPGPGAVKTMPGALTQARTAIAAIGNEVGAIIHGTPKLSSEEIEKRLKICQTCPSLEEGRCIECGCFVKIKASFRAQHCSIRKW